VLCPPWKRQRIKSRDHQKSLESGVILEGYGHVWCFVTKVKWMARDSLFKEKIIFQSSFTKTNQPCL
jgi:hypothetical protein